MRRSLLFVLLLGLLVPLAAGCGARDEAGSGSSEPGASAPSLAARKAAGTGTVNPLDNPAEVRGFLDAQGIVHGDIYLQDGLLYINVVGLNDEVERTLAERYAEGTYRTVDVVYSLKQLEEAQQKLADAGLYRKLNLYATGIDVIHNRVTVQLPDSSESAARVEIAKLIDPDMVEYQIDELSPVPHVVGTIVELDPEARRILVLEDGKTEPSYYFGFSEFSELADSGGEPIAFEDLSKGAKVRVWIGGAVNESMPAQATARRLELAGGAEGGE